MVAPRVSLAVDDAELLASFAAIRAELHITTGFDDATQSEADTVARRGPIVPAGSTARAIADRREIAFVTIDPQGSRDLDQAYAAQRTARGYRVWYAIADVASFIDPDSPLDHAARARGATIFAPDERAPLHPVVINEGAASLLPGVDRQAALWTIEIDEHGAVLEARVERATVRSRQQLSYPQAQHLVDAKEADESLALLARIGSARIDQERDRGAVSLSIPAQIVGRADGRFELEYEQSLPIEKWNAQISLMTGMAAARIMIPQKSGSVVNFSSIRGFSPNPGRMTYCAPKAAVLMMTKVAAGEWAPHGVRVNAIAPGVLRTPMWDRDAARGAVDEPRILETVPAHRLGLPSEVGKLVVFLSSDDAAYITGATHTIDGALTAIPAG